MNRIKNEVMQKIKEKYSQDLKSMVEQTEKKKQREISNLISAQ